VEHNAIYPKRPEHPGGVERSNANIAIVMQGPLRLQDDFTVETVRHYRATAPHSKVIVSTWKGEDEARLREIERAGALVLRNQRPDFAGINNINYQIASTRAGLDAAAEHGFDFVLKTRADCRMYAPRFADFLLGLIKVFPVDPRFGARHRIIALDMVTRLYVPHHLSDLMMFGHIADLLPYWSAPYSMDVRASDECPRQIGGLWSRQTPEVYLCENYYERIRYPYQRTLSNWWEALRDLFIVVDRWSVDHFWPKYKYAWEHREDLDASLRPLAFCSFADWLNFYRGIQPPVPSDADMQQKAINQIIRAA
jgi:hypothetical protein